MSELLRTHEEFQIKIPIQHPHPTKPKIDACQQSKHNRFIELLLNGNTILRAPEGMDSPIRIRTALFGILLGSSFSHRIARSNEERSVISYTISMPEAFLYAA
jgi:hypothetical protein